MEYLRAYTLIKDADVYVYQSCEIKKIPAGIIPQYWHDALSREDADKRIQGILETWKKYVLDELYLTIGYLEENLSNIELLRINDTYYLLYSVKKASGKYGIMREAIRRIRLSSQTCRMSGTKYHSPFAAFMKMFIMDSMDMLVRQWDLNAQVI